ncbi:hypothetical protein FRC01_012671 [Tulasnella sp. 417]|nr:hypothetical protein FRC01_012671 [Tulasnella sp. 417]
MFFIYLGMSGEPGIFYRRQFWRLAGVLGFPTPSKTSPNTPWVARPHTGAPAQRRNLHAFATTNSVTLTTKETSLMDSPSPPVSVPSDFSRDKQSRIDSTVPSRASGEVDLNLV